jgi:type IV secretory pathway VirB10-like protein
MNRPHISVAAILLFVAAAPGLAYAQQTAVAGCPEVPREDALPFLCAPPTSEVEEASAAPVQIRLTVPEGTPIRIALDQRARIAHVGQPVHGKVVEPIYAFDEQVIPVGSTVTGRVTRIDPVPARVRAFAYSSGNFTPFHKYQVTFDELTLPNGKVLSIKTATTPGTAEVVHLVANKAKQSEEKRKNAATRAASEVKQEAQAQIHSDIEQIKSPNIMQRLEAMIYAQSPVHRQFLEKGTRFNAKLEQSLAFGEVSRTATELAALGSAPEAGSLLRARLGAEVSSANAVRGATVSAVLTEPVFSANHALLLPADTKLVGEVQEARPARKLHRNGELRIAFNRIELPSGATQAMQGTLEGMQVNRSDHLALDDEGGTHATTPKTRYLSTGFSLLMLAAVSHPDTEHGTTDAAGDADTRAGAGISGSRVAGSLISLAARSQPVSLAFGALGATQSVYSNFLSRGKDVDLQQNTPLEIGFAPPHDDPKKAAPPKP